MTRIAQLDHEEKADDAAGKQRKGLIRIRSLEALFPDPRQSSVPVATFNLTATMVGGGILSLPFAFAQAGLLTGLGVFAVAGLATGFAMYLLMVGAQRTGSSTYYGIAEVCFGWWGGFATTLSVFVELIFVLVGYKVLLKDISSAIVQFAIGSPLSGKQSGFILIALDLALLPLFLQDSLYALRYTCFVGFFGALVLGVCLVYRCVEHNMADPSAWHQLELGPKDASHALLAFPIMALAFLCQFNTVSVYSNLKLPTTSRCKQVVALSCCGGALVYLLVGLAGLLYAYDGAQDDIFLNFAADDRVMLLGRVVLALTLLCGLPVQFLPTRESLFELCAHLQRRFSGKYRYNSLANSAPELIRVDQVPEMKYGGPSYAEGQPETAASSATAQHKMMHVIVTLGILAGTLCMALVVPGVAIVWSLCGSTVSFFIAFIFPTAFYIRLSGREPWTEPKLFWAWALLITSVPAMFVCTWVAVRSVLPS